MTTKAAGGGSSSPAGHPFSPTQVSGTSQGLHTPQPRSIVAEKAQA
jgi:hypothetical protein